MLFPIFSFLIKIIQYLDILRLLSQKQYDFKDNIKRYLSIQITESYFKEKLNLQVNFYGK